MFDWVPLFHYTHYFDLAVFFIILLILWQCHSGLVLKKDVATLNGSFGFLLILFLVLYMGLRPISSYFGDTVNYASGFLKQARINEPFHWIWDKEWLFYNISNWFAKNSDIHSFFLLCAALYIIPLWIACARLFKSYYFIPFVIIVCMFTFWSYGVNGIRNGIGSSLFILALSFPENIPVMIALSLIALGFHSSVILMIGAALLAWFIKNSYYYIVGWIGCVGVSYAVGMRIQAFLSTLSIFGDDRFEAYLTGSNQIGEVIQMAMTFRWDFLIYSAIGVAIGYYFIFRRHFKDQYYQWIYNIYLVTNGFWVLIIRANYSNRFAQISWFILPLILIYPFMKKRFWKNHEMMLALAIIVFYAFGFYTNIWKTNAFSALF